jgi:glycosyltransferase involved in cell wall biosynthesis
LPSIIASNGDRDGIPNVILEAMSLGVPVISTWTSGIPEVISDGVDGLLVPPGDAETLAQTIKKLSESTPLRKTMANKAREKMVSRFEKTDKIDELFDLFIRHME